VEGAVRAAWSELICDRAKFVGENILHWLWPTAPAGGAR
jgi:hypothetical protein